MRRAICAVLIVGATAGIGAVESMAARVVVAQAVGEVTSISPVRVHVGYLTCAIPAGRLSHVATSFVIGDPVKVACRNHVLTSIKYAPGLPGGQSDATATSQTSVASSSSEAVASSSGSTPSVGSCRTSTSSSNGNVSTTTVCRIG